MEIFELKNVIDRAEELAGATGNSGRAIRRFIDSYFKDGIAKFSLQGHQTQSLVLAYQASRLRDACVLATLALQNEITFAEYTVTFTSGQANEFDGVMGLDVVADIPDGMKARQEFLVSFAFGLRRILAEMALAATDVHTDIDAMHAIFPTSEVSCDDMALYLKQFEALLNKDYSDFGNTPVALISLASNISSDVASYDKNYVYDDEDDVLPAVPVTRPFYAGVPVYPVM